MSKSQKEVLLAAAPHTRMLSSVPDLCGRQLLIWKTGGGPVAAVNAICPISQRTELCSLAAPQQVVKFSALQ